MPIYEYQCDECGRQTEALQRIDAPPLSECPHCGGALRKLISAPAFQFKGSGWYVTDYAKKGGGGGAAKSSDEGSGKQSAAKESSGKESSGKESGSGGSGTSGSSASKSATAKGGSD